MLLMIILLTFNERRHCKTLEHIDKKKTAVETLEELGNIIRH